MRCRNCGWENPAGKQKCEKCNAPLSGSMIDDSDSFARKDSIAESLRGTIPESGSGSLSQMGEATDNIPSNCTDCGYPVSTVMKVCPNCGKKLRDKAVVGVPEGKQKCSKCGELASVGAKYCSMCGNILSKDNPHSKPFGGTVNTWEVPQQGTFCTLKPIAWRGEEISYHPVSYSGTAISLNRANTDPNNNTITSKEQAVLIREGSSWFIEDRSEQHTTFIRVGKRMKLENGDVIVLGNRLFEFKEK